MNFLTASITIRELRETETKRPKRLRAKITTGVPKEISPKQRWQISYLHNKVELKSPLFNGNYIGGDIDWGDGNTEDFKEGVPYKYSNNCEKITTFNIHGTKINSIKIPSIHSIKSIKIVRNLEKQ